jgi:YceI-like domain
MSSMRRGVAAAPLAVLGAILLAALSGCVTRQTAPPAAHLVPSPLVGRPFDVVAGDSQLIVLVYRAGPLAALGHNHVISCRCLSGTIYVPPDPARASLDLRFAVGQLTVDDPGLRAAEHSADFPPDVAQSARQGTRHNMLGAALLNAAKYPDIELRSAGLRPSPDGKTADMVAQVLLQVEGEWHSVAVPLRYLIRDDEIVVTGAFPLKQTDLGLTPFSALSGGLKVSDGMNIRLRLVARLRRPR